MLVKRSIGSLENRINAFVYSQPGAGKTRFALDFPDPVLVDFEAGYLTAEVLGRDVPTVQPQSLDDIILLFQGTDYYIERIREAYPGYTPKTWIFDTITSMQEVIMGMPYLPEIKDDSGRIIRPAQAATGIFKLNHKRETPTTPAIADYAQLHNAVRSVMRHLREMPYHTVALCHAALSPQKGERGIDIKESEKTYTGYPMVNGDLKYDIGGLADFFLYLTKDGGKYRIHTEQYGLFNARTKIAGGIDKTIDWTDKNGFEIMNKFYEKAKGEKNGRR